MVKCYEPGRNYIPDDQLIEPTTSCSPCGNDLSTCVNCNLVGQTTLLQGHALSETKRKQGVSFDKVIGQRSVYRCPSPALCTGQTGPDTNPCLSGYGGPLW